MFAPILAFTCDEIWLAMPHRAEDDARNVLLNVMNQPFDAYALSEDELAKWDQLIRVRTDVNGVLEAARAEKRIGKPLEAAVTLRADDDAAKAALEGVNEWKAANIDAALEPLPEQMDLKKRVVFQAVRVAVCGNMVSPPLGETMALVGRDDCLARIDRARTMAL